MYEVFLSKRPFFVNKILVFIQEEEYKRLSEALAEDGNYSAVGFTYGSDYYDPSEPTEEEEPSKQRGEGKGSLSLVGTDHSIAGTLVRCLLLELG